MATEPVNTYLKACRAILESTKANGYAKSYAEAGYMLRDEHARKVQALYILNNIQHWRGENSKEVRTFLKEYAKDMM